MIANFVRNLFWYDKLESDLLNQDGDSQLIRKGSKRIDFKLDEIELDLRVFVSVHPKQNIMPRLPVIMFIHGLGGQISQFEPLIDYFTYFSSVIAVDLPGYGKSKPSPKRSTYSPQSLVKILKHVLLSEIPESSNRKVVLVGHSMGSVLAGRLALDLNNDASGDLKCIGFIAICPPGKSDPKLESARSFLEYTPSFIFNLFRVTDRTGGRYSPSVDRMVDKTASDDIRDRQLRWNLQVQTIPWMNTASQFTVLSDDELIGLRSIPTFLVGAANDQVTPIEANLLYIYDKLQDTASKVIIQDAGHACMIERPEYVCGVIGDFVSAKIDEKMSLAWQLAYSASKSDKWSLKNEEKWKKVEPVGDIVSNSQLRGMKTLRQDDSVHSPKILEAKYPDIVAIVDISRDSSPYDPKAFERIKYYKFPTVSKIPPSAQEVNGFIDLIERIKAEFPDSNASIAIHCHYGFNRTGFFICAYLIDKLGYPVRKAVQMFKESRPPGIKHPHFIDELYVRYSNSSR